MRDRDFIVARMSPRELSDYRKIGGVLRPHEATIADEWENEAPALRAKSKKTKPEAPAEAA